MKFDTILLYILVGAWAPVNNHVNAAVLPRDDSASLTAYSKRADLWQTPSGCPDDPEKCNFTCVSEKWKTCDGPYKGVSVKPEYGICVRVQYGAGLVKKHQCQCVYATDCGACKKDINSSEYCFNSNPAAPPPAFPPPPPPPPPAQAPAPPPNAVQVISDLHLEDFKDQPYTAYKITPRARHLILAGDIGELVEQKKYLDFLNAQLAQFETVMLVPGNHEPWGSSWDSALNVLKKFEKGANNNPKAGRFVLLDKKDFRLPHTNGVIVGARLFSSAEEKNGEPSDMPSGDWDNIDRWTVEDHARAHEADKAYLNKRVNELSRERNVKDILVVTHWSPTLIPESWPQYFAKNENGKRPIKSGAFSTDLANEPFSKNPKSILFHGHTHKNYEQKVNGRLTMFANQRGSNNNTPGYNFNLDKVIFVGDVLP